MSSTILICQMISYMGNSTLTIIFITIELYSKVWTFYIVTQRFSSLFSGWLCFSNIM